MELKPYQSEPTTYQKWSFYQQSKSFLCDAFGNAKAKSAMIIVPMLATANIAYANDIPELNIDVSGLMKAFAVIIAAIATVGMAVLTVALTARAFKYIRTAF